MLGKYRSVIFDLDGTLMDTSSGIVESIKYVLKERNYNISDLNTIKKFIGPPVEYIFKDVMHMPDQEVCEAAKLFRKIYTEKYLFEAKVYPYINIVLDICYNNKMKCFVATNKRLSYTRTLLEHFSLLEKFELVCGTDSGGLLSKTDLIKQCIRYCDIDRSFFVMVGDSLSDSNGAEQAGIDFIAATYGFGFKNASDLKNVKHVAICKSPKYLLNILDNIAFT